MQAIHALPALTQADDRPPRRDLLEAVLLHLMTRHTLEPSPGIARGVVHHLHQLLEHPDLGRTPVDRSAYEALLGDWMLLACEHRENTASL